MYIWLSFGIFWSALKVNKYQQPHLCSLKGYLITSAISFTYLSEEENEEVQASVVSVHTVVQLQAPPRG